MPDNLSFLSPTGFKFQIQKLPHVNYFCTSADIPDITLGQVDQENIFIRIPVPGDKLQFSPLNLAFSIDEDMKNFKEIYDWLIGLGYPDNFQQRANLQSALQQRNEKSGLVYSDGSMVITTAQYQPNILHYTDHSVSQSKTLFVWFLVGHNFALSAEYFEKTEKYVY